MANRRNAIYLILIASLLTGLFTGRAFFFNIVYLFGSVLVIAYVWSWSAVRWININRRTRARRAQVGRNLDEAFIIRNRSWKYVTTPTYLNIALVISSPL